MPRRVRHSLEFHGSHCRGSYTSLVSSYLPPATMAKRLQIAVRQDSGPSPFFCALMCRTVLYHF